MLKKDHLEMLNNLEQGGEVTKPGQHDRVIFIDGLNLFLRNFAVLNFVNPSAAHIGGLAGFLRSLGALINKIQPTSIYIVFDGTGASTNRRYLLPEYKSNRHINRITNWDAFDDITEENDSKVEQITRLVQYLKCLPVKIVSIDKLEADDIIAYMAKDMAKEFNSKSYIVSSDRDFLQLVDDNITVYRPIEKEFYSPQTLKDKFGMVPENFIHYKVLLGDNSDNVPGVKGLGKKGIFKRFPELLEGPISFDKIYDLSVERLKDSVIFARIVQGWDQLLNSKKVMDLENPLVSEEEAKFLSQLPYEPLNKLRILEFMSLYSEDGLNHIIKNTEFWLKDIFTKLDYDA
jgi:5'-3' exonuclease|tara:strand:+ start:226 stop:1263 length:1038 start_codon:yes stop_codon:yes gene_type:complete